MTQNEQILNHILVHGSISHREAFIDYGVQSFTRRIADIRDAGYDLIKVRKHHPTSGQVYSRYYIRGTEPKTDDRLNG
ncbi:helix-turn-helix domain-containing protein [Bradyrhizobium sp. SZCCHNRI2049]|uniref:helix-turn-helix domain-containing protein n=1 Tax=Bradyrhizobium sp. SZCCHNRI2049 TaxID=3057287 RepID=UPI002916E40C|nr:helix-turn-helix domain-containing protein [Bradyrhizobium sp. SZCCHNRI2049]